MLENPLIPETNRVSRIEGEIKLEDLPWMVGSQSLVGKTFNRLISQGLTDIHDLRQALENGSLGKKSHKLAERVLEEFGDHRLGRIEDRLGSRLIDNGL